MLYVLQHKHTYTWPSARRHEVRRIGALKYIRIYVVEHINIFAYIWKLLYLCSVISKARGEYPRNPGTRYPRGVGTLKS